MRSGSPPTLWWLLMVAEGPFVETDHDVRVQCALRQELGIGELPSCFLEDRDEFKSMAFRFCSGRRSLRAS